MDRYSTSAMVDKKLSLLQHHSLQTHQCYKSGINHNCNTDTFTGLDLILLPYLTDAR